MIYYRTEVTDLGLLTVGVDATGAVVAADFGPPLPEWRLDNGSRTARALKQIQEYLDGRRQSFDLDLAPRGTAFQQAVWQHLQRIPYGQSRSYAEVAAALGRPRAARAVGRANATNPICILIPCHRVIGRDGALTGYRGGTAIKARLLSLERSTRGQVIFSQ